MDLLRRARFGRFALLVAALALLALPVTAAAQTNVGGDCVGGFGGDGGDGGDAEESSGGFNGILEQGQTEDEGTGGAGVVPLGTIVFAQVTGGDGGDGGAGGDADCDQIINEGDVVEQAPAAAPQEQVVVEEHQVVEEQQPVAVATEEQVTSVPLAQTGFDVWMLALLAGLGLTGGLGLLAAHRFGGLRAALRRNR